MKRWTALGLVLALLCLLTVPVSAALPRDYAGGALSGICADGAGLLVTDVYNKVLWRLTDSEAVQAAGQIGAAGVDNVPTGQYADGTALTAFFLEPWAVTPFLDGFAVSDTAANVVRYYDGSAVRTAVGSGEAGSADGLGTAASFSRPTGLATDGEGCLYIADTDNGLIRRVDLQGNVTTWFSGLAEPTGLCWAEDALFVAETGADAVVKLQNGQKTVIAGGEAGYRDGSAAACRLRAPMGVTVGPDGTVYIADTGNSAVRCLKNGRMTTLAAAGQAPDAPVQPRSLLLSGNTLLVTDTMALGLLELDLTPETFTDVPADAWYASCVAEATALGLTTGTGNGLFSPAQPVTRAQFVTMLARLHQFGDGDAVIGGDSTFPDVPADTWFTDSVRWAADEGLVLGDGTGFRPGDGITRQALVTILYRYVGKLGISTAERGKLTDFADSAQVADYAADAVAWAVGAGLLSGDGAGQLLPNGTATRAQTVKLLTEFVRAAGL